MSKRASTRIAKTGPKSMKELSDCEEEEQASQDSGDEVEEHQPAPKRARKQGARKPALDVAVLEAPSAKQRRKGTLPVVEEHASLIEILAKRPDTATAAAKAWISKYNKEPLPATAELLTLLVQVAGACVQVSQQDVEEEDVDALARRVAESVVEEGGADPLHDRRTARTLPAGFAAFCTSLVSEMDDAELLGRAADDYAMDKLMHMVIALSCSNIRPFRVAATLAGARLVSGLVEARKKRAQQLATLHFQQQAEAKKGRAANQSLLHSLKQNVDTYQRQSEALTEQINQLMKAVFAVRFRDTQSEVRSLVIRSIGTWVAADPAAFLVDAQLKYLGWALSDKDPSVRLGAVTALLKLYEDSTHVQGLRDFKGRFLERLKELPYDLDEHVSGKALELLARLVTLREMGPADVRGCTSLLVDASTGIRSAAAEVVVCMLQRQMEDKIESEGEDRGAGTAQAKSKAGNKTPKTKAASKQQDANAVAQQAAVAVLLEMMAWLQPVGAPQEQPGGRHPPGAAGAGGPTAPPLEPQVVAQLVDALGDKYPILQDVGVLAAVLGDMQQAGSDARLGGPAGPTHLACVLAHVAHRASADGGKPPVGGSAGKTKTSKRKSSGGALQTVNAEGVTNALMEPLPGLIRRYQTEPAVLASLLRVVGCLHWEAFALQGEERALGALLALVADQVTRHSDGAVLREAAACLTAAARDAPGTLRAAAELALSGAVTKVATGLQAAAKAVHKLSLEELREQAAELQEAAGSAEVPEGTDVLWKLKVALGRAAALLTQGATQLAAASGVRTTLEQLLAAAGGISNDEEEAEPDASSARLLGADITQLAVTAMHTALACSLLNMGVTGKDTSAQANGKTDGAEKDAADKDAADAGQTDKDAGDAAKEDEAVGSKKKSGAQGKKGGKRGKKGASESDHEDEEQDHEESEKGVEKSEKQSKGKKGKKGSKGAKADGGEPNGVLDVEAAGKQLQQSVARYSRCLVAMYDAAEDMQDTLTCGVLLRAASDLLLLFGHNAWKGTPAAVACLSEPQAEALLRCVWSACENALLQVDQEEAEEDPDEELDEVEREAHQVARCSRAARRLVAVGAAARLVVAPPALIPRHRSWLAGQVLSQMPLHGEEVSAAVRDVAQVLRKQAALVAAGVGGGLKMQEVVLDALKLAYKPVLTESVAQEQAAATQATDEPDTSALENALMRFGAVAEAMASLYAVAGVNRDELLAVVRGGVTWVLGAREPRPRMYFMAWGLTRLIQKLTPGDAAIIQEEVQAAITKAEAVAPRTGSQAQEEGEEEEEDEGVDPHWAQVDHYLQQLQARAAAGARAGRTGRSALKGGRAAAARAKQQDGTGAAAAEEQPAADAGEEQFHDAMEVDHAQPAGAEADANMEVQARARGKKRGAQADAAGSPEQQAKPKRARFAASGRAAQAGEVAGGAKAARKAAADEDDPFIEDQQAAAGPSRRVTGGKQKGAPKAKEPAVSPEGWHTKRSPAKPAAAKRKPPAPQDSLQASDEEQEVEEAPTTKVTAPRWESQPLSEDQQLPGLGKALNHKKGASSKGSGSEQQVRRSGRNSGAAGSQPIQHVSGTQRSSQMEIQALPGRKQPGSKNQPAARSQRQEEEEVQDVEGEEEEEYEEEGEGQEEEGEGEEGGVDDLQASDGSEDGEVEPDQDLFIAAPEPSVSQVSEPPPRQVRRRRI